MKRKNGSWRKQLIRLYRLHLPQQLGPQTDTQRKERSAFPFLFFALHYFLTEITGPMSTHKHDRQKMTGRIFVSLFALHIGLVRATQGSGRHESAQVGAGANDHGVGPEMGGRYARCPHPYRAQGSVKAAEGERQREEKRNKCVSLSQHLCRIVYRMPRDGSQICRHQSALKKQLHTSQNFPLLPPALRRVSLRFACSCTSCLVSRLFGSPSRFPSRLDFAFTWQTPTMTLRRGRWCSTQWRQIGSCCRPKVLTRAFPCGRHSVSGL